MTDQSLSDIQTGFGAASPDTLDTVQLISHKRSALFIQLPLWRVLMEDWLQPDKCELFTKIHDILDSALSK